MQFNVRNDYLIPTAVGVASFAVGVGVGWFLASRRRSNEVDTFYDKQEWDIQLGNEPSPLQEWVEEEVIDVIHSDKTTRCADDQLSLQFESDSDVPSENFEEQHEQLVFSDIRRNPESDDHINVFRQAEDDDWDYAVELPLRTHNRPYVIHRNEFFSDEMDCRQITVTYYAGDDVMCDEDNSPIYGYQAIFGELLFGHGSDDENLVYIRNEKLDAEYEVCRDPGYYQVEVLGSQIEHSYEKPKKKGKQHPKFKLDY